MRVTYPCHVLSFFLAWVVPIEETVQAMLHRLNNNPSLPDHTALTPTQIADLLNFVLRSTYFEYNRALYEQQEGAPMGSPVHRQLLPFSHTKSCAVLNLFSCGGWHCCISRRNSSSPGVGRLLIKLFPIVAKSEFILHAFSLSSSIFFK